MPSDIERKTRIISTARDRANQDPEVFGPRLAKRPDDEGYRIAAMIYYSRVSKNFALLRNHTLAMIEHHPGNDSIYYENTTLFYVRPKYREEVIDRLEQQVRQGHKTHNIYFVLANTCRHGAIPPMTNSSWSRERFIRYFGLPKNAKLQKEPDPVLADKAVLYYKSAIEALSEGSFYYGFYSTQLVSFLQNLGRNDEAVEVCERALPKVGEVGKADFLAEYAYCLMKTKRTDEAKQLLSQVRECDTEGFEKGPAHATTEAEMLLGLIALKQGNVTDAGNHLLASCQVQTCPHNRTKGFPLWFATKLLEAGQPDPVIQFCQTVLTNFTPNDSDVKSLLHRAQKAQGTAPTPAATYNYLKYPSGIHRTG